VQVQQRQHLSDLRGLPCPGRQDRRGEPAALAGVRVDPAVIDPRRHHLHRAGRGEDLTWLVAAVAHHQPPALLVPLAAELGDIGVHLRLQGFGQHPPGTLPNDLVDQRRRALRPAGVLNAGVSRNYREHGSYLPDRRSQRRSCLRAFKITGRVRPLHGHPQISSIARQRRDDVHRTGATSAGTVR
jgi:hypothetical protein